MKKAGEVDDPLKNAWFVPARDLDDYKEEERVYDRDEEGRRKLRVHPRGRFIYRLAGRDRQKSASYYTPESLTRCVVKYALRELIPDDMPADRILDLTVCEPAMGSAAFLNEAVNQLAEKYLERKQRELGKRIPHAEYADELQQVKHYIADRQRLRGGPQSGRPRAGRGLAVAELHQSRRPRPLVRLPARLRQLAGGRAAAGVHDDDARQAEPQVRAVVQPRASTGPRRRRRRAAGGITVSATGDARPPRRGSVLPGASITSCCRIPAWSPTVTRRPRPWNPRTSSGSGNGARPSSSRSPTSRSPSSKRCRTA